jgi:peptidoglycan L-alanyl-D-glutamate endopeptidase CwlK
MEVIKHVDCSIICGYRNEADQNKAFESGASKLKFPRSMHNRMPSLAVDAIRHPIQYENTENHLLFAGFVLGVAEVLGVKLRWGGDWDRDFKQENETFRDFLHFELMPNQSS